MSWFRKFHIPLPGAALALLAFFLPWLTVSCQGTEYAQLSGYDLVNTSSNDFTMLWVVPVVAVLSALLALLTILKPEHEQKTAIGHIVASIVAIGVIAFIWYENVPNTGETLYEYDTEYGSWLTIAGFLIILIGGILSLLDTRRGALDYGTAFPAYDMAPPPTPIYTSPEPIPSTVSSGTVGSGARPTEFTDMPPVGFAHPSRSTEVLNLKPDTLAWLVMREGARAGHTFRVSESTSIGRDADNDIIIDDTSMSGQHAKVKLEDGGRFMLYDLASTNGVFIYDAAKSEWERIYRHELADGQQVKFGRSVFSFMHLSQDVPGAKA